jgi:hypothetical protein
MFFYILLLCIASFFAFIYSFSKIKEISILSKSLCFLTLYIPSAIRYGIGTDYPSYVSIYNDVANNKETHGEMGFIFLNRIVHILGGNAQYMFAVMAFLTYFILFRCTGKKKFYLIIPVYIMLYYIFSYSGIRQALSVVIVCYAMNKYDKKKLFSCFFYYFLASLFHISSLLFFLYFLFCSIFCVKKYTAFIICFVIYIIMNTFNVIDIIFSIAQLTSYGIYLQIGYIRKTEFRTGLSFLVYFLMIFSLLIGINGTDKKSSNARIGMILFFFMALLDIKIFILNRLRDGFMIVLLPALGNVDRKYRKPVIIVFLIFTFASFLAVLINGKGSFIPYNTIFK